MLSGLALISGTAHAQDSAPVWGTPFNVSDSCDASVSPVVTNDDDLAARIRLMKNFGFYGFDNVVYVGTSGKMEDERKA
jgi:hypothetical protein